MDLKQKNGIIKTLGPQESHLILGLYNIGKQTFTLETASKVSGLSRQLLQNRLYKLVKKGVLTRLDTGLYIIVPFNLGHSREYLGNPYSVAKEIVFKKARSENTEYCISHASAMNLHQMLTQPQFTVYTTVTGRIKKRPVILGTEFRFVTAKKEHYFGVKRHWIEKSEMVLVSDIEKTIIDGLKMPEYCGGITDVAKGLWIKRNEINPDKLVQYAHRMNIGVICRRLGYLLELYEIGNSEHYRELQKKISKTYLLLDPTLIDEGPYHSKWKLRLNITQEELKTVIRT